MHPPNAEISKEVSQFEAFKSSPWATSRGLRPVRTEVCVGWCADGRSVSAGQIDALYVDKDGLHYLFDFKRVAKKHKLDPNEKGFAPGKGKVHACGLGPMAHLPDTHFQRYSLQTSIYNLMLMNTHGIDVDDRMYLLRMHADRDSYELVQCRDLRVEAQEALQSEATRLAHMPSPAAATPPTAPQAGSPAPMDANGGSPTQSSSETRKRPRGPTPKGKVWQDGQWVAQQQSKQARTPTTDGTLKVRPMGKAPKGKKWDGIAGCWVALGNTGCFKRNAPSPLPDDENSPPRGRHKAQCMP